MTATTRNCALFVLLCLPVIWVATTVQGQKFEEGTDGLVSHETETLNSAVLDNARSMIERGRTIFRYDPFGSNLFFNDALRLNETLEQLPPRVALGLGLKIDFNALRPSVRSALRSGAVDLEDPVVTQELLRSFAVLGVVANVDSDGNIDDVGITCALCHSTVDDSIAPGVGNRLDGWANRDLNVGGIVAAAPTVQPFADLLGVDQETVRAVLNGWGPGRFDAHLNLDGKAFRPDGETASVLIPPAFGLAGVNLSTYVGWGSVSYWNAFVGNLEMNGSGHFFDPRLDDAERFPVAAANGFARREPVGTDLTTSKLGDLHFYQLALAAPAAPEGSFDSEAASRGQDIFNTKARCASCHVPPLYTDPGWNLHAPEEIGIDAFQADRGPEGQYRTTPLRGLWTHTQGGFYHDGRFATLAAVIDHYDSFMELGLEPSEKVDLAEFLRSL